MDAAEAVDSIISGHQPLPSYDEIRGLVGTLKRGFDFTHARSLLGYARVIYSEVGQRHPEQKQRYVWATQQLALCTYKDENLHPATRFDDALVLLNEIGLRETANPETLALGGGVCKRKFDFSGQLDDLYQALGYYRAAWERDPKSDLGYGGINAAFVLDMIAARADRIVCPPASFKPTDQRAEARQMRQAIANQLEQWKDQDPALAGEFFVLATLAEAYFGLKDFEKAGDFLEKARGANPDEWARQTLVRQLVALARLQETPLPRDDAEPSTWAPPWKALERFLKDDTRACLGCFRGKMGLALSGGGFRASFFEIGVLARLAEIDVLRSVEALSTVSGGSIVGAYYYLALRRLQQNKPDREISRTDYCELIRELCREFFAGTERNLRMRTFANLFDNLRMLFSWPLGKFRTIRLAHLYERELFSKVGDEHASGKPRPMHSLLITPKGEAGGEGAVFNPKFSNWRRRAKVPALVLNATSLNTGHAWHFTAKWMGEPPALVGEEVDMKLRYRRPNYDQIESPALRNFSLGRAVGASTCVPALFAPVEIKGLYEQRTVRLVDGGVHDNQGIQGLLVEGCNVILCSDASGQMGEHEDPDGRELQVLQRANDTLMERVRENEYQNLRGRQDQNALSGLFFVHLKKGLDLLPLDWVGCQAPSAVSAASGCADYGVAKDLQAKLAAIRTDLDLFSEVEANALMVSGYLMTEHEFKKDLREWATLNGFDVDAKRSNWEFLKLEALMRSPPEYANKQRNDLALQLDVSSKRLFKTWRLSPSLKVLAVVALISAAALVFYSAHILWGRQITLPPFVLGWPLFGKLALGAVGAALIGVVLFTAVVNLHLLVFDPIFRSRGRLTQLFKL